MKEEKEILGVREHLGITLANFPQFWAPTPPASARSAMAETHQP